MAICEFSYKKSGADDTVRCKLLNPNVDCCCCVKFCHVSMRWENNSTYKFCPIRKRGIELKEEKKKDG